MMRAHDHDGTDKPGSHNHDHGDHHDHHKHSGLGHVHAPANFGRAFAIGVVLNGAFVVIEVVYGILAHSVALIADAGHNLSDALGLAVAWAAVVLAKRKPTNRFTYGLGGTSILAALFNAVFLLVVTGGLTWEAVQRFVEPQPAAGATVMIVAACGIVLNGFCAWLFASGREGDLNVRGAYLHMAADALVSLGVVLAGLIILLTGWTWVDSIMTLIINAVIIRGTWSLLTGSVKMSLNAVPSGVNLEELRSYLLDQPGVTGVHDLHVWSLSTTETAMTCHLVYPEDHPGDDFIDRVCAGINKQFRIGHATLQIEKAPSAEHLSRAC